MSTLVKTESFYSFERAYADCFGTSYVEEKNQELERNCVSRRIIHTRKDVIESMNRKGISTERILKFVDSVRHGKNGVGEFIKECFAKDVPRGSLIALVNDVGLTRIRPMSKMCNARYDTGKLEGIQLKRLILLTAIMIELRIDTYSTFSLFGAYDYWCKDDEVAVSAYQFFSKLYGDYEKQIIEKLQQKFDEENPELTDYERDRKVSGALISFWYGRKSGEEYGIANEYVKLYSVFKWLSFLTDGQCEWYWSQD